VIARLWPDWTARENADADDTPAVVPLQARALLSRFDERLAHCEAVNNPE